MSGFSAKLPMSRDDVDGIKLIKNFRDLIKQNMKNLILTIPGEKIMDANFGVGLQTYLFRNNTYGLQAEITSKVNEQVSRYMPFINIKNIEYVSSLDNPEISLNYLKIIISYVIVPLGVTDNLTLSSEESDYSTTLQASDIKIS